MAEYTLYHNPFSVHSLMVRYTISLLESVNGHPIARFNQKVVDQSRNQHLEESFLLKVNPKGQVPALTSPSLPEPITDSLEITTFLTKKYPGLVPEAHKECILALLTELHEIQPFSLCVSQTYNTPEGVRNLGLEYLLGRSDISDEYRRALQFKSQFYDSVLLHALDDDKVRQAELQAKVLFGKVSEILSDEPVNKDSWLFGSSVGPSALDGHLLPFIVRLMDARRSDIIPEKLLTYATELSRREQWQSVTLGLPTMQSLVGKDQTEKLKKVIQQ